VLRYLSLPIFLFGAWILAASLPDMLQFKTEVHGLGLAVFLTIAGLVAILWPEVALLWRRFRRADA
jgi:uncharacterized membrane protein YhaH (DUF805 family)